MTTNHIEKNDSHKHAALEAVLFMHGNPVTLKRLSEIIGISQKAVRMQAEALRNAYEERQAGLTILIVDDRVQMVTHATQAKMISAFTKQELTTDLSPAAMEVLAIIAYRGPIAKIDIEAIRGVNCAFTLRNLLMRGLIERTAHPTDHRAKLYRITIDLLRTLGVHDVSALPEYDTLATDRRIDAVLYSTDDAGDTHRTNDQDHMTS